MMHAVYLLLFILAAAPLAAYIPLASLGAVLVVVAWNMAEKAEFAALLRSRGDAVVLLATFLVTIFEDLMLGIAVGVTLGAFLFLHRMAEMVEVKNGGGLLVEDQADDQGGRRAYNATDASDTAFMVYKISGAFFFGATATVSAVLDRIGAYPATFVFDFSEVPLIDTTAAKALEAFAHKLRRVGTGVYIAGARPSVQRTLQSCGLYEPSVSYAATVEEAKGRTSPKQVSAVALLAK